MDLQPLLADDDAVSEVIGVILMVAIVVVLAAVVGTFVLGIGEQVGNAQPTTTFDFDYQAGVDNGECSGQLLSGTAGDPGTGSLTVTHNGGNNVTASTLTLIEDSGSRMPYTCAYGSDSELSTGDSIIANVDDDDTITVSWQASGGGDSAPLGEWEGPGA